MLHYIPLISTGLFQVAGMGHVVQMFRERSAAGHSVLSWCLVVLALCLWLVYYRVMLPDEWIATWATVVSLILDGGVLGAVIYFRRKGA